MRRLLNIAKRFGLIRDPGLKYGWSPAYIPTDPTHAFPPSRPPSAPAKPPHPPAAGTVIGHVRRVPVLRSRPLPPLPLGSRWRLRPFLVRVSPFLLIFLGSLILERTLVGFKLLAFVLVPPFSNYTTTRNL